MKRVTNRVITRLLALVIVAAVQAGAVLSTQADAQAEPTFTYILPEGFHGWACADFGVAEAAPLGRDADGSYLIKPVTGRIVATSSFPHLTRSPLPARVLQKEKGRLRPVEVHDIAQRGEYESGESRSRYCLFFGSNYEASLVPRPPRLRESKLGTTPLLQRFEFSAGSLCDFRDLSRVCLEALDIEKTDIAATISGTLPQIGMRAADTCRAFDGVVIQYRAEWSMERDASVPRHRTALAQVRREQHDKGSVAKATWIDVDGGSADEVATRFGRDLAEFFNHAAAAACGK